LGNRHFLEQFHGKVSHSDGQCLPLLNLLIFILFVFYTQCIYFIYKNEYRSFKPVEITMRRELRQKGEKYRGWTNSGYNTYIHGNVTVKLPV
jgi:hypothetical protein